MGFLSALFGKSNQVNLSEILSRKPFLVDVRTPAEFSGGSAKGAINIPLDQVASKIAQFKGKQEIVVFCRSGNRSGQAKAILDRSGIANVINGGSVNNVINAQRA
jgi:rhodanese-related sulfurtransferase